MAREIDFSPLARYTARQQQNEDMASQLLTGNLAKVGKTFEPLLRQGFTQKMIAESSERPWEVLGKLAAYNPEMYKSFAPEAKQAHLAHISKETDFSAKLQDLEEKQKRLDALNDEKRKWHEDPNFEKGDAHVRFMYPVTADKDGILRQTGKPPIENEIAFAEAELNAARKGLQTVLKTDEVIPTLDNEKVLKAKQQALVNEGYLEEAKRLESNLLSDEQRFLNALGKTANDASARILALEQEADDPNTTNARKGVIGADLRTLRGFLEYIRQGQKPYTTMLDSWISAGRNNSNLDFSKNPLEQTHGAGNVHTTPANDVGVDNNDSDTSTEQNIYSNSNTSQGVQNIYSNSKTLQGVKNDFGERISESTFKNDAAKKEWVDEQIELVNDNPNLNETEKADFENWARNEMKKVKTDADKAAAERQSKLNAKKVELDFTAFNERYEKLGNAFKLERPKNVEGIPTALKNLKANLNNTDPKDPIVDLISTASQNIIGYDITKAFKPEIKPTTDAWNNFVNNTFGLSSFEKWFNANEHLMAEKERKEWQTKINGVKGFLMRTGNNNATQQTKINGGTGNNKQIPSRSEVQSQ